MRENLKAEIVAIGTEILLGDITDTNSVFIAQQLKELGVDLFFMTSVGDNIQRIASALRIALDRADIVITCGGLGPTVDDMTRDAVAACTGKPLQYHQELYNEIADRFASYGAKMPENNQRQAFLPADAIAIHNPVGTAPAFVVETEGEKAVISLPGVPREMKYLFKESVVPYLRERYRLAKIRSRILKTAGIGESALDELIGPQLLGQSNPTIGLAAHQGIIDVRLTAKAISDETITTMLDELEIKIRERAGRYIFGKDSDTLESVFAIAIRKHQTSVAIIEAGLGDAVGQLLSESLADNEINIRHYALSTPADLYQLLDIDPNIVSLRDLTIAGVQYLHKQQADICIVIASLPDVDENSDDNVGTAVTVQVGDKSRTRVYGFGAKSELASAWVSRWALSSAWRMLQEANEVD